MSKLLTWLSVSFNWYTYCVYTTPPTVTCGGGLPCAVNWATLAAVATAATPSARRVENVIGCLPSWGMGCGHAASQWSTNPPVSHPGAEGSTRRIHVMRACGAL